MNKYKRNRMTKEERINEVIRQVDSVIYSYSNNIPTLENTVKVIGELIYSLNFILSDDDINEELQKRGMVQYMDDDNLPHWDEDLLKRVRQAFTDGAKWGNKIYKF